MTEPESLTQIIFFLIIAAAVAWVVELSERRRAQATQRLGQAMVLSDLARGVVHDGDDIPQLLTRLSQTFRLRRVDLQRYSQERKMWVTLETTDEQGISAPWTVDTKPTHVGVGDGLRLVVGGGELTPQHFSMIEAHGARITAMIDRQEIDATRQATAALEAERVLLVEDDVPLANAVMVNFKARGYEMKVATTASQALKIIGSWQPASCYWT
ncbi:hypothetical protein CPPEL_06085 [Corynebacterium pseudopelargi]|uniref:Response regulatory domain-containing protein n=1 Tax=Corynebacterium pseudopelargi TaxID=2080757 RepID=A0A3G6IUA5_9CORY|nr:hypothetical protein CPPEL_06085 [Corynebacterium pseudopelargi]